MNGIDSELTRRILQARLLIFDFDGVFTDNTVWVMEDGTEMVRCWRSDGIGLRLLEKIGLSLIVLSAEENPVVMNRCRKLKIQCVANCSDKPSAMAHIASKLEIDLSATAYLGNDVNDRECLGQVGLPMVVHDAHPDVVPLALYRTSAPGGFGAVREVCDLFHRVWTSSNPTLGFR